MKITLSSKLRAAKLSDPKTVHRWIKQPLQVPDKKQLIEKKKD